MEFESYETLWRSDVYNNVSAKNTVQVMNLDQIKLKVNDTYKKDDKITWSFEPSNDKNFIRKAYLETK